MQNKVLKEYKNASGGAGTLPLDWVLVKYSPDFIAWGCRGFISQGFPVNQCGAVADVKIQLEGRAKLCKKHIAKYEEEKSKSKNPKGWEVLIDGEQKELEACEFFLTCS